MRIGFAAVAAALLLLLPVAASAGPITTITFNDTTSNLSITVTPTTGSPTTSTGSCTGETCTINVYYPSAACCSGVNSGLPLYILDPGGSVISDEVTATFDGNLCGFGCAGYKIDFTSATDETAGLGTFTGGTSIIENGNVQSAFSIDFENFSGTSFGTAVVQFQSDLDAPTGVPEPATLALFGFGLGGLARLRRRNKD